MQQQQINFSLNQSIDQQQNNFSDNRFQLKLKLKKKLSLIHKRMAQQPKHSIKVMQKHTENNDESKGKVQRKDTLQTKQTLTDFNQCSNKLPKDQKIDDLIIKSQNDPFLRRKLKTIIENDLKCLKKLNQKHFISQSNGSKTERQLSKSVNGLKSSQQIEFEYKHIPKDISIILNDTVLSRRSDPGKKSQQRKIPSEERIFQNFTDEQQKILINNQKALNQEFTTLRKQSYKNKISHLESFRSVQEKQKAITDMTLSKFLDKATQQNCGQIKKNSITQQKYKVQK